MKDKRRDSFALTLFDRKVNEKARGLNRRHMGHSYILFAHQIGSVSSNYCTLYNKYVLSGRVVHNAASVC